MLWTVVLEKTLESPLDLKEIQPVHPKEDQSWVFIGRTDAEAETPILWPPHAKSWLTGKDPDAGRDWGQEEKGTTEDEMAGWHHWLDGHESQWTPGVGDRQGGLACCDSWSCKESDTTEPLIWSDLLSSECIYNSWKIESWAPIPFPRIENPIIWRKWAWPLESISSIQQGAKLIFSRAQSCWIWNWLDCGDFWKFLPPGGGHLSPGLNLRELLNKREHVCNSTEVSSDPSMMNLCYVQLIMNL